MNIIKSGKITLNQKKMKQIFKIIGDLFKQKCPNCKGTMESVDEVHGSQVYRCNKCNKEWF
jgi:tRNA(Ile2) C34 agmatinyltransferase TiaS